MIELEWKPEDYLRAIRLHWKIVLSMTLAFGGCTALQMAQLPNIYQATARIIIESTPPRVLQFQEVTPYQTYSSASFLQTEYKVITSRTILSRVIEDLHLAGSPPFSRAKDPVPLLQGMVSVNPVRATKLVDVSVTGTKPELITKIANSVVDSYAKANLERQKSVTTGGIEWLMAEVSKMEEKMRASQLNLQKFMEEHGSVDFGTERQGTAFQRFETLNDTITETRKQRIEAETKYREKHPILLELQAKERELERALLEQQKEALVASRLAIQYEELTRDVKTNQGIYNVLLTRLKELSVQEGVQGNNIQVVDYALVPTYPVGPPRQRRTSSATFLGFCLGAGLALLMEFLSKTIRNRSEFERILEIPFLGHIPLVPGGRSQGGEERFFLFSTPHGVASEAVRAIRTTLEFLLPTGQPHVLLMTSALPEEGKTFVSLSLALVFQEMGRKVILIDADMRRPSLHRTLDIPLEPGLSGYLQSEMSLEEIVQTASSAKGLPVISAGITPPQSTNLLVSPKMQQLLERLKGEYQYVFIDTPPVVAVADASALASFVDGVVYVVRAGRTHRDTVLAGKQRLVDLKAKLLGGILNGSRMDLEYGYRYAYYYYHGKKRPRREAISPPASPAG